MPLCFPGNKLPAANSLFAALLCWCCVLLFSGFGTKQHPFIKDVDFLINVASGELMLRQPDSALQVANTALQKAKSIQYQAGIANANLSMARIYLNAPNYPKAIFHNTEALRIFKQLDNVPGQVRALNNLGYLRYDFGDYQTALQYYQKSMALNQSTQDTLAKLQIMSYMALTLVKQNALDSAESLIKRVMGYEQTLNSAYNKSLHLTYLGEIALKRKAYDLALAQLFQSLIISQEKNYKNLPSITNRHIAEAYMGMNKAAEALPYARQAASLSQQTGQKGNEMRALEILAKAYDALNMTDQAFAALKKHTALRNTLEAQNSVVAVVDLLHTLENDERDQQLALLQRETEVQDLREQERNFLIVALSVLVLAGAVIFFILYRRTRFKNRVNAKLTNQNEQIKEQKEELEDQRDDIKRINRIMEQQHAQLKIYSHKLEEEVERRTKNLRHANMGLQLINRQLDTFIYKAYHDVRGPLVSLQGIYNLALLEVNDPKALEYLDRMRAVTNHLRQLLSQLMQIATVREHEVALSTVRLKKLVNEVVQGQSKVPGFDEVSIVIDLEEGLEVQSDVFLLRIALQQVISNAITYRKKNGLEPAHVHISVEKKIRNWYIRIHDNGQGIDSAVRRRVFEMFFRGSTDSIGPGLGLFSARLAMSRIEGAITFKSVVGQYTTFRLRIPSGRQIFEEILAPLEEVSA